MQELNQLLYKIDHIGNKRWYYRRLLHKTDGPAIELHTGGKEWYINGELHREDGPAVDHGGRGHDWFIKAGFIKT